MARRFEGKVIVITGAAGGIGRAAAVRLAGDGARLILVDVADAGLAATASAAEAAGAETVAIRADVTRLPEVERYVAAAAHWGGIDAFFNNAGVLGAVRPLVDYPEAEFDRVLAVNVRAVWLGLRAVGQVMLERGRGTIVNTASIAGLRGTPNLVAYTASKHAVVGLTRTAAIEFARRGVRVNAVCPSPIETPMVDELHHGFRPGDPGAVQVRMIQTIPLRRYGTPDEVASLVAYLLSDEAAYLTGGIYTVDGGASA